MCDKAGKGDPEAHGNTLIPPAIKTLHPPLFKTLPNKAVILPTASTVRHNRSLAPHTNFSMGSPFSLKRFAINFYGECDRRTMTNVGITHSVGSGTISEGPTLSVKSESYANVDPFCPP